MRRELASRAGCRSAGCPDADAGIQTVDQERFVCGSLEGSGAMPTIWGGPPSSSGRAPAIPRTKEMSTPTVREHRKTSVVTGEPQRSEGCLP